MHSAPRTLSPDFPTLGLRALPVLAMLLAAAVTATPATAQETVAGEASGAHDARPQADPGPEPGPGAAPPGLPWHHRLDDALVAARRTGRPILIDLYADWCGLCRRLEREVFATEAFRDYADQRFVFLRVDIDDGGEGTRLRDRFASFLPTTVLIDHRMALVGTVRGYQPTGIFIGRVEMALIKHQQLVATYQRLLREDSPEQLLPFAEALLHRGHGARAATIYRRLIARGFDPPGGEAWLRFRLAAALRIAHELAAADEQLRLIRSDRRLPADPEFREALALLEIQVARDRIDCARATDAVENFLEEHPGSRRTGEVLAALRSVETDPQAQCE